MKSAKGFEEDGFEKEYLITQQEKAKKIKCVKSNASFHFCRVMGFIYGGTSSKWWMFRKHFNHMDDEFFKGEVPFYPWECLSIQLLDRDVFLIIKNESLMEKFLKLLIYKIKTVDGNCNSSSGIENALSNQIARKNKNKGYKINPT